MTNEVPRRFVEIKRCNVSVYIASDIETSFKEIIGTAERLVDKYDKSPNGGIKNER